MSAYELGMNIRGFFEIMQTIFSWIFKFAVILLVFTSPSWIEAIVDFFVR